MKENNPINKYRNEGFTIVELLIVVVVIGILAAISIVAYNGIQSRAYDTVRANDMANIKKALLAYNVNHGGVPRVSTYKSSSEPADGGWDHSTYSGWMSFMKAEHGEMPRDPKNTTSIANGNAANRSYRYFCYDAGSASGYPDSAGVRIAYRKDSPADTYVYELFRVDSCLTTLP